MPVQIPVVIDIEKAFDDAARRVSTAIRPLEKAIDDATAHMNINIALPGMEKEYMSLKKLLSTVREYVDNENFAFEKLQNGLENTKREFNELNAIIQKRGTPATLAETDTLAKQREAIILMKQEIEIRTRSARMVEEEADRQIAVTMAIDDGNAALLKTANTMKEISDKISSLRGMLQNLDPKSKEWKDTAKEIKKATAEAEKYEKKLNAILSPKSLPGSVSRIRQEMDEVSSKWNAMSQRVKFDKDGNLSAKAQALVTKYKDLTDQAEKFGRSIDDYVKKGVEGNKSLLSGLNKVLGAFGVYASVHQMLRFVKQIRDVTGELEYQRVALGHLLNDMQFGNELFEKTVEAAKESPFRITQLVTYTKQLAAYRIEQENLFDVTQRLADISAGLGVDMNRLILAYGQVRAASVLRGQELRQFTEAGIPLVELLAEKFRELGREGTTTADVFKLISERAVPFSMIKDIFEDLTNAGGMFYKMQEEQAKTLKGRWEKLKDAYDKALMSVGENDTFQKWNDVILKILNGLADNLGRVVRISNAAVNGWIAYKVATSKAGNATISFIAATIKSAREMRKAVGVAMTFRSVMGALGDTLKKVSLSSWIGLALSGIATLVTYFTTFRNKIKDSADELTEMGKAIEKMTAANKRLSYEKELVSSYEKLAKNTVQTATAHEHLASVMSELRVAYPEVVRKIEDENMALEDQVSALNAAAEARHQLSVEEAQRQLDMQRLVLRGLERQTEKDKQAYESATRRRESAVAYENNYRKAIEEGRASEDGTFKDLKRNAEAAAVAEKEKQEAYEKSAKAAADARNEIRKLENIIHPQDELSEWADGILKVEKEMVKLGEAMPFTDADLKKYTKVADFSKELEDNISNITDKIEKARSEYESMSNIKKLAPAGLALFGEIGKMERTLEILKAIKEYLGIDFPINTKDTYQQDPFIAMTRNRIKFMQDFKKGYEDLNKYMSSHDALAEQAKNMSARGISLDLSPADQQRAAQELSKWYQEEMDLAWQKAKAHGATGKNIEEFLQQQIKDTSNRGKALRDFQSLLQSLFDAKTDFDTTQMTKNLENAMKKVKEEISHSETARNFFNDILEQTGDQELATNLTVSVYGDIGGDFKDNVVKELEAAFRSIDWGNEELADWDSVLGQAVQAGDIKTVAKYMDLFPKEWQERLKEMLKDDEEYNSDRIKNLYKTYEKTKTYAERITDIQKREAEARKKIAENENLTPEQKASLTAASVKKENEEIASVQKEILQNSYEWIKAFEDLENVSSGTLKSLIRLIDEYIEKYGKDLDPEKLRELSRSRESARAQLLERNSFVALGEAVAALASKRKALNLLQRTGMDNEENLKRLADEEQKNLIKLEKALSSITSTADETIGAIERLVAAASTLKSGEEFSEVASDMSKILSGSVKATTGLASIFTGDITPQSIAMAFNGLADVVSSIWDAVTGSDVRRANREIERQQELIDTLEKSYRALDKAMDEAFGNDYMSNYAQQLQVINAEIEAYRAQAAAERSKGKKKDEEKIKEYEQNVVDAMERIEEAGKDLQAFFLGTDLASASQDFASAWLDAYQEFGDTAGAIEERMEEMVKNLVEKAALSGIVESILGPWYKSLNDVKEWDAATIASKMNEARGLAETLNNALLVQVSDLQSAGAQLRGTVGQFTGIKRDIANASEESISGLAAGVNTQNFFLQHIDANVAAIVLALTGESTMQAAKTTAESGSDPYKDAVLENLGALPQMRDDMAAIRLALDRVVKLNGDRYAVNVRM